MLGYAQLLESNQDDAGVISSTAFRVIRRSGGPFVQPLSMGFLDISMIEAGRPAPNLLSRRGFCFPEFLGQIVDMFSLQARDNGLEFTFEAPKKTPSLESSTPTDEERLRQIPYQSPVECHPLYWTRKKSNFESPIRIRWRSFDIERHRYPASRLRNSSVFFKPFERARKSLSIRRSRALVWASRSTRLLTEAMGGDIAVQKHTRHWHPAFKRQADVVAGCRRRSGVRETGASTHQSVMKVPGRTNFSSSTTIPITSLFVRDAPLGSGLHCGCRRQRTRLP